MCRLVFLIVLIIIECALVFAFYWTAIKEVLESAVDGNANYYHVEFGIYMLLFGTTIVMGAYIKLSSTVGKKCRLKIQYYLSKTKNEWAHKNIEWSVDPKMAFICLHCSFDEFHRAFKGEHELKEIDYDHPKTPPGYREYVKDHQDVHDHHDSHHVEHVTISYNTDGHHDHDEHNYVRHETHEHEETHEVHH
jgi:hypothetical protein